MVDIKLDKQDGEYTGSNETVTVKTSTYDNQSQFQKVTYTIKYKETYANTIFYWNWYKYLLYLYIKDLDDRKIFEYNVAKASDIIDTVEAYYNKDHLNVPLVFLLKIKYDESYYTYYNLTKQSYSTGLPEKGFKSKHLLQKLRDEDNRVNRIKFFNTNNESKNCTSERKNVEGSSSLKYFYSVDNKKRYEDHELTKKDIFKYETGIDVNGTYFQKLDGKYFDEVNVYCTNERIGKVLLVEFVIGNTNTYFSRQDKHGHYWLSKPISDLKNELAKIEDECRNKFSYLIHRTHTYSGVNVSRENEITSFEKYKHTPDEALTNKTNLLLYNGTSMVLDKSNGDTKENNLKSLTSKTYSEVCVFFIQSLTNTPPVFIHLIETSGSKTYWLQKVNPNGLIWKEINHPQLGNSIAYRLELTSSNSYYGNNSIKISPLSDSNFNAYSHTAQLDYKGKKSYLTYRGNLLSLETINDIKENEKLDNIQEKKLSSVSVYYDKDKTDEPPVFLELYEYPNNKKYCLLKVDKEGFRWKQLDNDSARINNTIKRNAIMKEAKYYTTKSIVILANENENGGQYPVYLVDNSVSAIVKSETQPKLTDKISVKQNQQSLSDRNYSCYEHTLNLRTETEGAQTIENNLLSQVSGLILFIGSKTRTSVDLAKCVEIKLYSSDGKERKYLYYDSNPSSHPSNDKNKVYCYFSQNDYVLLMIYGGGCFYTPKSKNEYFNKWVQVTGISSFTDKSNVDNKLKDINKELNLIDLSLTSSYGLKAPETGQLPQDYDTTRINVTTETPSSLFKKVTHTTKNTGPIGKITHSGSDLEVVTELGTSTEKTMSQEIEQQSGSGSTTVYNTVFTYHHPSDSLYHKPLLIGISKGFTKNPDLFFERVDNSDKSKWKKVTDLELRTLKQSDSSLAEKINKIHNDFNYSIKIQLENQGNSGIDNYNLELIKNNGSGTLKLSDSYNKITSDQCGCLSGTSYTCYKHTITLGSTRTSDVGGLRLYIGDKELTFSNKSGKLVIYYNYIQVHVHVYFYTDGSNIDKVPLLFQYDGKYYKPNNKNDYFNQWVFIDGLNSSGELQQITTRLHQINKTLNEVNISFNTTTSYGLNKPEPANGIQDSFRNRINVKKEDQSNFYKKLVHYSINKGPIGRVIYNAKPIKEIDVNKLPSTYNHVCVYYHFSDTGYNKPLLICIGSQNHVDSCNKWYYRRDVQGEQWKDDEQIQKYQGDSNVRKQLDQINGTMSNYLYLQIHQQETTYQITTKTGSSEREKSKQFIGSITTDGLSACGAYEVTTNYRCIKHKLADYYNENKSMIQSTLSLVDPNPTLEVKIEISGNIITLLNKDGISQSGALTYGSKDALINRNPFVYFLKGQGYNDDDKVPLLFNFADTFFGPVGKDLFYEKWKEYKIDTSTFKITNSIKAELNKITRLLNEIQLQTTDNDYGYIKPTKNPDTLKAIPRVNVRRDIDNISYHTVTHSTEKTGCVGTVKYSKTELQISDNRGDGIPWSQAIEQELEKTPTNIYKSLEAYYHHSDKTCKKSLLIKISGGFGITPFYYEREKHESDINWKKVQDDTALQRGHNGITDKVNQIFYNFNKSVKIELATITKSSSSYLAKLFKNDDLRDRGTSGSGMVKLSNDPTCSKVCPGYTCIKHTVTMNIGFSSQVGGLRFYFGDKEAKTYDNRGSTPKSVFYYQKKNDIHVYLQESTNVPLLFRYNGQCFKPYSKADYFTKWVYDSSISGKSHPQPSKLDAISEMLNEINLEKTGNGGVGAGTQQYGLTRPIEVDTLSGFNENRITATRDPGTGGKFLQVTHTTNNKLGIGKVRYGNDELVDTATGTKNLSDAVKDEGGLGPGGTNTVTVYYHKDDEGFTTPLLLGFGNKGSGVSETGGATLSVFYERGDSTKPPVKWVKVGRIDTTELGKPGAGDKISQKLDQIRYNIGKSLVINIEKQEVAGDGYQVQVVENNGSRKVPQSAGGVTNKITVSKAENCSQTTEFVSQTTSKYTCFTHTIPKLTEATDHPLIGGVKFYICDKNYLPTYGPGGFLQEHIYYNTDQTDVKVYFYSSGHGPPISGGDTSELGTQTPDKVPLLVQYNGKYFSPKDRFSYFTNWEQVTATQGEGDSANTQISKVLDKINKDLNSIDISKTGDGGNKSYGLTKPSGGDPCSSIANFCDRIKVEPKEVTKPASQADGDEARASLDTDTVIKFRKVTHSTTNRGPIGGVYSGAHHIKSIDTTKLGLNCVCNQVLVYYGPDDKDYKNPLLICLTEQPKTQAAEPAATTITTCKKWYKRNSIDVTGWEEERDSSKYESDDQIKTQLQDILGLFKDYLYIEIEKGPGSYEAYVQAKTGPKKQVTATGDNNKIKVTDATDGSEAGSELQVPDDYKGYKHKLSEFYNGAKDVIKKTLDPQTGQAQAGQTEAVGSNHVESSGESQDFTLYLRLQIAGQAITLATENGGPVTDALKYGKEESESSTDTSKNDPIVYFYGTGGSTAGSDTVPLLFRFGTQYFGPKDRQSYFQEWKQYDITVSGDGNSHGLKDKIKNELDKINGKLNEIDLTKTVGSRVSEEYGLEKPGGVSLTNSFSTKRIQVTRQDKVVSGTTTFTYVTHKTVNNYNIGNINDLGTCRFDNKHKGGEGVITNEAVAVYSAGKSPTDSSPSLVLITENKGSGLVSGTSTVHGYYDLSSNCPSDGKYQFKTVSREFNLNDLSKKEKVESENDLLKILLKIGIVAPEVVREQSQVTRQQDSAHLSELQDTTMSQEEGEDDPDGEDHSDEAQDDRPKVGLGGRGLVGSGGMAAGTIPAPGEPGPAGPSGARGPEGPPTSPPTMTETGTPTPPGHNLESASSTKSLDGHQPHTNHDGDVNDMSGHGGGPSPDSPKGPNGKPGEASAIQAGGGVGGSVSSESQQKPTYLGEPTIDKIIDSIVKAPKDHPAEFYGGTGSVGGVGVIATVGAVVYKK